MANPTKKVRRLVTLRASTAELRTAVYDDKDYLVVPVTVMVGNAVVRPLFSEGPEFVPAEELSELSTIKSLDGRPVVPDHPRQGTSSANVPGILDTESFGLSFNTRFENGNLVTEAWINSDRADKVGDSAKTVIANCQAHEMVEISGGAWVTLEQLKGQSPSGEDYEYVWRGISYDHLAMGLNGSEGACSVEMGCGAMRSNKTKSKTQLRSAKDGANVKIARKLKALLTGQSNDDSSEPITVRQLFVPSAEGLGSKQLNSKLSTALFNAVPAYGWLWDSYPDDMTVIYTTYDAGETFNSQYWMRSYSVDSDENVTLGDDEQEMLFDEASAFVPKAAKAASCGCQKNKSEVKGATMDPVKKKELIARLVANSRVKLTEAQLTAMADDVLTGLDDTFKEEETTTPVPETTEVKAETKVDAKVETTTPTEIAEDQLPQSVRDRLKEADELIAERKVARAARKAELVACLKEPVKHTYTEEQLQAMDISLLESTIKLLKLDEPKPDYSGRGLPTANTGDDLSAFMPPDSYGLVAARKAKAESANVSNGGSN